MTAAQPSALIMAGGTGGHIYPGLAVADELRKRGWRIVWLGNADGAPMGQVSGGTGAAPVWAGVMHWLHTQAPNAPQSHAPHPPPGLVAQPVAFSPRLEPPRREWFLTGTEQALLRLNETKKTPQDQPTKPRILSPTNGTIVALDPDIPPRHQQLALRSEAPNLRWRIGGQVVARGASGQWAPWPGVHQIELVDARGAVVDAVRVEVRGAGLRTTTAAR